MSAWATSPRSTYSQQVHVQRTKSYRSSPPSIIMPSPPSVTIISRSTVRPPPQPASPAGDVYSRSFHLTPWDLSTLSSHYIQKGLLFTNLPSSHHILPRLRSSLSAAFLHFFPLAGRLVTHQAPDGTYVSIDCAAGGAEFIHASADKISASDVLASKDIPPFVRSFFPYNLAISHDGHSLPLLAVQVTELADGAVFVACCFNHVVGDGTSYWQFFNAWAEISRAAKGGEAAAAAVRISRPPVHDRWFMDGVGEPPFKLPLTNPAQFTERLSPQPLRERMFHFSPESVARLKVRANNDGDGGSVVISSFQALVALVWSSITRARGLPAEQKTSCRMAIQNRPRMRPTLPPEYFGNTMNAISATVEAGELLANRLGWAARMLNRQVAAHDDGAIKAAVSAWHESPMVYGSMFDKCSVMIGGSPRFDMYGCDFGWGKAVAARSGAANKFDGKVSSYPGREGGGSVDLEVCLLPEHMRALEADDEFMAAVTPARMME